jgi:hypothetical protein
MSWSIHSCTRLQCHGGLRDVFRNLLLFPFQLPRTRLFCLEHPTGILTASNVRIACFLGCGLRSVVACECCPYLPCPLVTKALLLRIRARNDDKSYDRQAVITHIHAPMYRRCGHEGTPRLCAIFDALAPPAHALLEAALPTLIRQGMSAAAEIARILFTHV